MREPDGTQDIGSQFGKVEVRIRWECAHRQHERMNTAKLAHGVIIASPVARSVDLLARVDQARLTEACYSTLFFMARQG